MQVAIITGAGQGVGKATALLFAQHGAKVVASDLDSDKCQATVDFINNSSGTAVSYPGRNASRKFPAEAGNSRSPVQPSSQHFRASEKCRKSHLEARTD